MNIRQQDALRVTAEASSERLDVWLYIQAGIFSGGTFIAPEAARELAQELMTAAALVEQKEAA